MADDRSRVACVVVTYDALPWIERCLASVAGSADRRRRQRLVGRDARRSCASAFPRCASIESENLGLAAGWNRGIAETDAEHVLVLNADAWLVEDALARLVDAADAHPRAAAVGPRLLNPDGSLQRSVRGFPTPWRLATEYLYLRKLAPRLARAQRLLRRGLRPRERARGRVGDGRLLPPAPQRLRRGRRRSTSGTSSSARRSTGCAARRMRAGSCVHAGRRGASTSAAPRTADACSARTSAGTCATCRSTAGRARRRGRGSCCAPSLLARGRLYRGERGRLYREAARWLGSGDVDALLAG